MKQRKKIYSNDFDIDDIFDDGGVQPPKLDDSLFPFSQEMDKLVAGNEHERLLILLTALTGYVDGDQQFLIVGGTTSTGKSYTMNSVVKTFIPDVDLLELTSASDTALLYQRGISKKKIFLLSEMQKMSSNLREILKSIHSRDGGYKRLVTTTDRDTMEQELPPMSVLMSYATEEEEIDSQMKSRCILLNLAEDIETNKKILNFRARKRYDFKRLKLDMDKIRIIRQRVYSMNKVFYHTVVIPFAESITKVVDATFVRSRSDIDKYFALISAMAKYNHEKRLKTVVEGKKVIFATPEDAYQVLESVGHLLEMTTKELSETDVLILSTIFENERPVSSIRHMLREHYDINPSPAQLRSALSRLAKRGYVDVISLSKPNKYKVTMELKKAKVELKYTDLYDEGIKVIDELYPQVKEQYLKTMSETTTHPITGKVVRIKDEAFTVSRDLGITPVEEIIKAKAEEKKKKAEKKAKEDGKKPVVDVPKGFEMFARD